MMRVFGSMAYYFSVSKSRKTTMVVIMGGSDAVVMFFVSHNNGVSDSDGTKGFLVDPDSRVVEAGNTIMKHGPRK